MSNSSWFGKLPFDPASFVPFASFRPGQRVFGRVAGLLLGWVTLLTSAVAQPASVAELQSKIAVVRAEMEQHMQQVRQIVNQPVPAVRRTPQMSVGTFKPGWFHEGAGKPDFASVDVRQTQDTASYDKNPYSTSDQNPGFVWVSRQIEFNPMTKFFYTNFALPKKRLTEAEMLEINRLYRLIGQSERTLQSLMRPEEELVEDEEGATGLQRISRDRLIKAGIALAIVLGLYVLYRKLR